MSMDDQDLNRKRKREDTFPWTVLVQSDSCAAIIGTQGAKIKEIQSETSCTIDVQKVSEAGWNAPRLVRVYGDFMSKIEGCRSVITVVKDYEQQTGPHKVTFLLPPPAIGGVIGQGGEHIKGIKERHPDVIVRLSKEEWSRGQCEMTGEVDEIVAVAEEVHSKVEESITERDLHQEMHMWLEASKKGGKGMAMMMGKGKGKGKGKGMGMGMGMGKGFGGGWGGDSWGGGGWGNDGGNWSQPMNVMPQQDRSTWNICVSGDHIGSIIGKSGANIASIQSQSGAKVNVPNGQDGEQVITVSGNMQAKMLAMQQLMQTLTVARQMDYPEFKILIPANSTGRLMGPKGQNVNQIGKCTECKIGVLKDNQQHDGQNMRVVELKGKVPQMVAAASMIFPITNTE